MELSVNELRELVAALSQSDIAELTLKSANFELVLRKQGAVTATAGVMVSPPGAEVSLPASEMVAAVPEVAQSTAPSAPPATPPGKASDLVAVSSPMVGTFYSSPAPDEPPFVNIGDRIAPGQTVCIIEAMKLMNELEAEVSGEIVEILVENSQPVEFGQTLMWVKPA
ncbi:MAG: acetyl-CoA carboxylase biotin carboxyl carrier protein [Leptolyngbya sp. LCM1.Bin17]|nr:MAG: acetyl-CoA carboxylase biotin carboxyl carrier protein [Leptolyngbya sp. LCM1.Bin17]